MLNLVLPPKVVRDLAEKLAFKDFPKAEHILTIARIESTFKANARNGVSKGIMQVNNGPMDLTANMKAGVKLLREYYVLLGSEKAAVIAYNTGPGNYRKGNFKLVYWNKYKELKHEYEKWLRASAPSDETSGSRPVDRSDLRGPDGGDVSRDVRTPDPVLLSEDR